MATVAHYLGQFRSCVVCHFDRVLNSVCGLLPAAIRRMGEGNSFSLFTSGGVPIQPWTGGYPIQPWTGGGVTWSSLGGGVPHLRENSLTPDLAWYMFRLEKKFSNRDPLPPVKGKICDNRFGLIHVQTGKKIFEEGPPPSKGKIFWHQIWLDTCSDWKKNFRRGTPPQRLKGKIFDTRFGLIHVQTGKNFFWRGTPPPE